MAVFAILVTSCATVPPEYPKPAQNFALQPAPDGGFYQYEQAIKEKAGEDHSGFILLDRSDDALLWRLALADTARHTLDVQYYLWYGDEVGRLFMRRLVQAADRGVRVRILIDDFILDGKERNIAALNAHPNLEIRIFNPWQSRDVLGRGIEFMQRMDRLNQRMHNKLMVADNQASIVGGRNIGNHYFGLGSNHNFRDLDVLCIGPITRQVSGIFDHFWNSELSVPASIFDDRLAPEDDVEQLRAEILSSFERPDLLDSFPVQPLDWSQRFGPMMQSMVTGTAFAEYDLVVEQAISQRMVAPLRELFDSAEREILIVNAYLLPGDEFIARLQTANARGVKVRILTNSLSSQDVAAVNSHYKHWRKPIVETGTELYEQRADARIKATIDVPPAESKFVSLHDKALVVDRRRLFIGSMNLDPRSVDINTEMGIFIDSPELAERLARLLERDMSPENAWQVRLDENDKLYWQSSDEVVYRQPARNNWQRFQDMLFGLVPKDQL